MKKQELIHLHGLLAEVCEHYEEMVDCSVEHGTYTELGVRPTSIHKSKTDHKAAVFALADGITDEMDRETEAPVPAAAD
ncbi:metal-binding protein [Halobacteriales archaeon QH_7_69_31]|nr:MAG: metal-binding protein [Halobacteriales archaeon QH_7_69_31]